MTCKPGVVGLESPQPHSVPVQRSISNIRTHQERRPAVLDYPYSSFPTGSPTCWAHWRDLQQSMSGVNVTETTYTKLRAQQLPAEILCTAS
jgi:hypothetical protein